MVAAHRMYVRLTQRMGPWRHQPDTNALGWPHVFIHDWFRRRRSLQRGVGDFWFLNAVFWNSDLFPMGSKQQRNIANERHRRGTNGKAHAVYFGYTTTFPCDFFSSPIVLRC